jgi:hypothetical protein
MGGHGGRRPGSGRPKGLRGIKTTELAEMLDEMGANPAKALARLGLKAEREGNDDLAIRAFTGLMPFRYPKLKEGNLALGLDGSFADQLAAAEGRLRITVVSGIDRPPDDPEPVPSPPSPPPTSPPPQPSASSAAPPAASPPRPKPRPAAPPPPTPDPPEPPAPVQAAGSVMSAHAYWTQKREPEVKPISDYDPWEMK